MFTYKVIVLPEGLKSVTPLINEDSLNKYRATSEALYKVDDAIYAEIVTIRFASKEDAEAFEPYVVFEETHGWITLEGVTPTATTAIEDASKALQQATDALIQLAKNQAKNQ
ncbi:hypothetical protein [Vibrio harveyi]|uniref:hypothetical protein n=1 Tax=Vibrio harveyi TaxID=669 RepID=UPI0039094D5A